MSNPKLWGGRFSHPTDTAVEAFSASVHYDQRLAPYDIAGSIAHARMLAAVGVLTETERDAIVGGLEHIGADIEANRFSWSTALEDVHMNIEARLTEAIGETGKKLHTGRSRNDQVATDMRLFVRHAIDQLLAALGALRAALLDLADQEAATIMPGFTHMQSAQPVTFGHHLLAWHEMLVRDAGRLADARRRVNVSPLGAAALAGTSFPIDRYRTATELGFDRPTENSLDSVSDRDFVIEMNAHCALAMVHLSRIAEELVLWSSNQFGFIDIGDAFCTGSSIMPQKKNPDVAELIRGKTARVNGNLHTLLMLMKAQPLAYNRDNQEDKEPLFDTVDTTLVCVTLLAAMIPAIGVRRDVMRAAAARGYATATDLADYLVRRGVAFRDAHEIVGRAVRHAIELGVDLADLSLADLQGFCPAIEADIYQILTLEGSINARNHIGGTAPAQVRAAVQRARRGAANGT